MASQYHRKHTHIYSLYVVHILFDFDFAKRLQYSPTAVVAEDVTAVKTFYF